MGMKKKMRYHFIPMKMIIIKNLNKKITIVSRAAEKLEPLCITCVNVKWRSHYGIYIVWQLQKKKIII